MFDFRRFTAALAAVCLLMPLSACTQKQTNPPATETETEDLYAHYDALVTALRRELAALRTDTHMTTEILRTRIDALEAALESLGGNIPTVTEPLATLPVFSPGATSDTEPSFPLPAETGTSPESGTAPTMESALSRPPVGDPPDGTESEVATRPTPEFPTETQGRFIYILTNGSATVTGFCGETDVSHITIPDTLGDCPVTRIADNAFEGMSMRSITLPSTLRHIGWFAFAECGHLRTITIPASVEQIDYGAFARCPLLTVYCPRGSYAARYAAASSISCVEV